MKLTNQRRNKAMMFTIGLMIVLRLVLIATENGHFTDYDALLFGLSPMILFANIVKIGGKQFAEMRWVHPKLSFMQHF